MPDGSPTYTLTQFLNGQAPKLEMMLQNLLADRFKLRLHRESKEVSGYALVLGKGQPKATPAQETDAAGPGMRLGMRMQRSQDGTVSQHLTAAKTTMNYLALMLVLVLHQPVVDRTGLTGDFTRG